MIGASAGSGDTLIACHFPVVQLPSWQLPVPALCSSARRPSRLLSVGLTRAVSLPERDSLNREHAFSGGRRHFSNSYGSLNEDRAEEEGGSDSSGRYDSTSSPEDAASRLRESSGARTGLRPHNSFLPTAELDEDEEDDDSDGGNLHKYHEDSSFVLHGNSNWPLRYSGGTYPLSCRDVGSEWSTEGTMLGPGVDPEWLSKQPNQLDSLQTDCQGFQGSRSGVTTSQEDDSGRLKDSESRCIYSQHKRSPQPSSQNHAEYVSDSSCNSSDGILVNFCTIYNGSNNPATPQDLSSPAVHPSQSTEGSVFLNLQPVPKTPAEDLQQGADTTPSASYWSPQGLDSNCNLYSVEPLPSGLSSLEVSDLTACLQSQATLAIGTNQKYYKLVTCDLSSQSPSPAWSSHPGVLESQSRSSLFPPSESHLVDQVMEGQHKEPKKDKEDHQKEKISSAQLDCSQFCDFPAATASREKALCRQKHADSSQGSSHTAFSLSSSQVSPQRSTNQDTCSAARQPSLPLVQEHHDAADKGACSLENEVVRYSKAQRPTSLPIQPFVLAPASKPKAQNIGCLLEQYMNRKSASNSSQTGFKFKGKRSQCFSNLQLSPMGSHYPVFLEAPSSSDTCSSCTPSPEYVGRRHTWSQSNRGQRCPSPSTSKTSLGHTSPKSTQVRAQEKPNPHSRKDFITLTSIPNQSNLVKIPTCQDLIKLIPKQNHASEPSQPQPHTSYQTLSSHTPPTLPLSMDAHHPSPPLSSQPETKLPPAPQRAAPSADSGFFHGSFAAALSSVAPLSSLSSLLSFAASAGLGGRPGRHSEPLVLSDKPPAEFCLSPDTSYESMSLSHLQRRGLLRSVSRAVDLIMAHFGSSRDPEEKMRLGNSSRSPTIAGLVLEHLCPTIQNILEDGLRDHKLDLIIGQRRNHSWRVVEVSTRIGPSTKVLHSLVTKIKLCPQLPTHCMKLRAFIMGLLNLRALEFWLSHLQSQKDVVTTYYHSWGFLSMSLGQCQPLFQELLLLLQPLSVLPFDLNLLLEPRLLRNRQLCSEEEGASPPPPCSALLVTSWPLLQADKRVEAAGRTPHQQDCEERQASRSPTLAPIPERNPESSIIDDVLEGEDSDLNNADHWSQISMYSRPEMETGEEERESPSASASSQAEGPCQGWLRWAKLFGAADTSTRAEIVSQSHTGTQSRRSKRPSEWLHLDGSQFGLLARSFRSVTLKGAQADNDC